ncbi:hypothetical protein, partial [Poseidonibacter sp.]|uniref:hypothetical protein n=1 Tax=Poseidonibacter sp. TaxID=2321188 RepID=UPI003C78BF07
MSILKNGSLSGNEKLDSLISLAREYIEKSKKIVQTKEEIEKQNKEAKESYEETLKMKELLADSFKNISYTREPGYKVFKFYQRDGEKESYMAFASKDKYINEEVLKFKCPIRASKFIIRSISRSTEAYGVYDKHFDNYDHVIDLRDRYEEYFNIDSIYKEYSLELLRRCDLMDEDWTYLTEHLM